MKANKAVGIGAVAIIILAVAMLLTMPAVSAWAGITQNTPSTNQEVDVGSSVYTSTFIKNYGAQDLIGVQITGTATGEICYTYDFELGYFETIGCSGTFTMPDEMVTLYFRALRAEGSEWIVDNERIVTLTPYSAPTPTPSPTPDPCQGVTCTSYCVGDRAFYNGFCMDGTCYYSSMPCSYGCSGGACNPTPTWTPTPTPTATPTFTPTPTPTPTPDPGTCIANYEKRCFGDYLKTCNAAGDGWDESKTVTCTWGCDTEKNECPAFEAMFAILGLLTVAYFVWRRKEE